MGALAHSSGVRLVTRGLNCDLNGGGIPNRPEKGAKEGSQTPLHCMKTSERKTFRAPRGAWPCYGRL